MPAASLLPLAAAATSNVNTGNVWEQVRDAIEFVRIVWEEIERRLQEKHSC